MCRILNEAVLDGHLAKNPIAGMKKLREVSRQRRYLTKEELGALIANCPEHFKPFLVTAAYTGARKGELTRLRWSDLDFESGKIALYRPKVGNADWIDMHPAVERELGRLKTARTEWLREEGKKLAPEDHVFLSRHGTPFVEIRRSWVLALKAAGLDGRQGLTPHSLRQYPASPVVPRRGARPLLALAAGVLDAG
jgi:integrase